MRGSGLRLHRHSAPSSTLFWTARFCRSSLRSYFVPLSEGGASCGAAPHDLFGCAPRSNRNDPPLLMSRNQIQFLLSFFPSISTLCIYALLADVPGASIVNVFPRYGALRWITTRLNTGLTSSYAALAGSTV